LTVSSGTAGKGIEVAVPGLRPKVGLHDIAPEAGVRVHREKATSGGDYSFEGHFSSKFQHLPNTSILPKRRAVWKNRGFFVKPFFLAPASKIPGTPPTQKERLATESSPVDRRGISTCSRATICLSRSSNGPETLK
jgi:hypothetical protein